VIRRLTVISCEGEGPRLHRPFRTRVLPWPSKAAPRHNSTRSRRWTHLATRLPRHDMAASIKSITAESTTKSAMRVDEPVPGIQSMAEPYADSLEHILAEIERIDIFVEAQVARVRKVNKENDFQGLYISEQEVEGLLATPIGLPRWATITAANEEPYFKQAVQQLAARNRARERASIQQGIPLRLSVLTEHFQLDAFDVDVLLVCLAAEIDLRFERLYAYLQDDVTKKRPSVDLVLNLLCTSFAAKLQSRSRFESIAPLLKHSLIAVQDEAPGSRSPLLNRPLKLDDRIVSYLLGRDEIDVRLSQHVDLVVPARVLKDLILPEELSDSLALLMEVHKADGRGMCLYFQGPHGVGKRSTAEALAGQLGLNLLVVNSDQFTSANTDARLLARLISREASLQNAVVYWQGFDVLLSDERRATTSRLLPELHRDRGLVFLSGEAEWEPGNLSHFPSFVRVQFPRPAYCSRVAMWNNSLEGVELTEADMAGLASKFRFTGGQIRDAAATSRNLALRRAPENPSPNLSDLLEACRLQSNRKLSALASRITPRYSFTDIVLPADRLRQLREVCSAVEYRSIVYDQWGFDSKMSLGKGLNLLFAGPSGTGKTMAAEAMAHELGLDMYRIDLSTVISKYIGETEKNLSRIFEEAATSNAILFFDEADALFGKRSEVRDSHDRYANIEINYLLQKMEQYEGTVILATNLRKNMDDAFVRRIQFTIEFPFPTYDQRLAIWQKVWPASTPREDLDLEFMARRFEIAGGNIRNIALSAAFLAAEDGGCVKMRHLLRATWQEYQKMGNVIMESEFCNYKEL
jgi:AAA+ superfamily predicted ATPase